MTETATSAQNVPSITPANAPPSRRLKWRDRHKKLYEGSVPIIGMLLGMVLGIGLLTLVMGPVMDSNKVSAPLVLGLAFIAAGILWVGLFLGVIAGYITLIAEKVLADPSKMAQ